MRAPAVARGCRRAAQRGQRLRVRGGVQRLGLGCVSAAQRQGQAARVGGAVERGGAVGGAGRGRQGRCRGGGGSRRGVRQAESGTVHNPHPLTNAVALCAIAQYERSLATSDQGGVAVIG